MNSKSWMKPNSGTSLNQMIAEVRERATSQRIIPQNGTIKNSPSEKKYTEIRESRCNDFKDEIEEMYHEMTYYYGIEREIKDRISNDNISKEICNVSI